jgi:peptide-methionine (S)-S-oxide reductase
LLRLTVAVSLLFFGLIAEKYDWKMVVSKTEMPKPGEALPGRQEKMSVNGTHAVNSHTTVAPFPAGTKMAIFGMGCFWGAERLFWKQEGVHSTHVGYAGGMTPNPTYEEVCSGLTGHNEVVRVIYDPSAVSYDALLALFWNNHDPTQGMKQDIDIGTQYRSGIYYFDEEQRAAAETSRDEFQVELEKIGLGRITTEIKPATEFYYAEDYHQQYLHKNPAGFCGLRNVGASCPRGVVKK